MGTICPVSTTTEPAGRHQQCHQAGPHAAAAAGRRRWEKASLAGSIALVLTGFWWLARPADYPFGPDDRYVDMSLMAGLSSHRAAIAILVSGAVSALAAAAILSPAGRHPGVRLAAVVVSAPMAVAYAYLLPDISILILVAYSMTLSLPAFAVFLLVGRRAGRRQDDRAEVARRAAVAGGVTLVVTIVALLVFGRPWEWGNSDEGGIVAHRPLVLLGSVLVGLSWAATGVRAHRALRGRCVRCGRPGPAWTSPAAAARWGRAATWAAALTPLPYVLARLTWLTPWPYGESAEHLADNPGLWVFGLGLAAAGELGTWLTLGLVKRRGEILPRWLPGWGGRPVPVMAAVVPGFVVALLMCVGGHSVIQQAFGPGTTWADHSLVLLVPLPFWGPLLALGTLGYWYRRRGQCPTLPALPA